MDSAEYGEVCTKMSSAKRGQMTSSEWRKIGENQLSKHRSDRNMTGSCGLDSSPFRSSHQIPVVATPFQLLLSCQSGECRLYLDPVPRFAPQDAVTYEVLGMHCRFFALFKISTHPRSDKAIHHSPIWLWHQETLPRGLHQDSHFRVRPPISAFEPIGTSPTSLTSLLKSWLKSPLPLFM